MEKDRILSRLEELIEQGKKLGSDLKPENLFLLWRYNCQILLQKIYPDRFKTPTDLYGNTEYSMLFVHSAYPNVMELLNLLISVKENLELGLIGDLEYEVRRDETKSLLDYCSELFDEKDEVLDRCACILARIVLEKMLKILCDGNNVDPNQKAQKLNQDLMKAGVYNKTIMHQITGLLNVGNAAAHDSEEWAKIGAEQRRKAVRDIEELTRTLL